MSKENTNLVTWIKDAAESEPIEAVVIGEMGWGEYGSEGVPGYAEQPKGKKLSWEEAERHFDYDFYRGYGSPGCNAVYVWTATKIIFVTQYDGSTSCTVVPRHPIDCMPHMPGG